MIALGLVFTAVLAHEPRPTGDSGETADRLARDIERAVNAVAWSRTRILRWDFAGRRQHVWDRERERARVTVGERRSLLDLRDRSGRVFEGETELTGDALREALDDAYAAFINDSFWLNPLVKLFDPGTVRERIVGDDDGGEQLLLRYSQGGLTPGDAYLWHLDAERRPIAWQLWVSVLPFGGLRKRGR